jgi:hypothetical protein
MIHLDFKLHCKNNTWLCQNEQIKLEAQELEDLDSQIKHFLQKTYQKGAFSIKYYFDFDDFPLWMRQYMPHYFNRNLIIKL